MWKGALIGSTLATLAAACQSTAAGPAVFENEKATEDALVILREALGRNTLELGTPLPTDEPVLVVLPPPPSPLNDRSVARPDVYDIVLDAGVCTLRPRQDGAPIDLDGVACRLVSAR
ncbi:hypothetical protein [Parvularcula sp. LCG005]|uniref:hypothetical protein n=1 Tax=Parvularcula sp. LCG005 TaxID=3078805 RepID=UPI0029425F99|nr:hypothetical protein [Parvularcula sp. LCG005]WOI54358.1 hypothetical protein RUI03_04990 [Parvularcula sp. LCG005]